MKTKTAKLVLIVKIDENLDIDELTLLPDDVIDGFTLSRDADSELQHGSIVNEFLIHEGHIESREIINPKAKKPYKLQKTVLGYKLLHKGAEIAEFVTNNLKAKQENIKAVLNLLNNQ